MGFPDYMRSKLFSQEGYLQFEDNHLTIHHWNPK